MSDNTVAQANWHYHFPELKYSSKEFYDKLKSLIEQYQFPKVNTSVSSFSEGGLMSAKREYLTVIRGEYRFDICAAPFGKSFFVSWWLTETAGCLPSLFARIPIIGGWLAKRSAMKTFYQVDTQTIFKESMHALIVKAIDSMPTEQGFRLPDYARTLSQQSN